MCPVPPRAIVRICGSGKLRADSKSAESRVASPPMKLTRSRLFARLEAPSTSFFGTSPDRFVRRDPSALD